MVRFSESRLGEDLAAEPVGLVRIDLSVRFDAVRYHHDALRVGAVVALKLVGHVLRKGGDDRPIRGARQFTLGPQEGRPAKIAKGRQSLVRFDERVPVAGGMAQDGLGIRASARLIHIGELERKDTVNDIVSVLREIFSQHPRKRRITDAPTPLVRAENMHVSGVCLARCGNDVHVAAEPRQGGRQLENGAFGTPEGDVGPFCDNRDCLVHRRM
jgi:hypothetical protein